jgi:hypothetical protein
MSAHCSDLLRAGWFGDRIPVGTLDSRTHPDSPWGPHSILYNGYLVITPAVKWPGLGVDQPAPPNAEVKER